MSLASEHIATKIMDEIESVEHSILSGVCSDYTMYREHIGMLTAYRVALTIAKRASAAVEEDVD